ncbi:MAG: Calx-beta domain-containing protein [Gammaproteobacteria bacterium]
MLAAAYDSDITYTYTTIDDTARSGSDYEAAAGSVTFAAGETRKSVHVRLINDTEYECGEYFRLQLNGADGNYDARGTITNDGDAGPVLTFSGREGEVRENAGKATINVNLTAANCKDTTVNVVYSGDATSGSDYVEPTSFVIPAGENTASFDVAIIDDEDKEDREAITLTLSSSDGITAGDDSYDLDILPVTDRLYEGFYGICSQSQDGLVKCWGYGGGYNFATGEAKEIGDGDGEMGEALLASDIGDTHKVVDMGLGEEYTCALYENKQVKCWGGNRHGYLGLGVDDSGVNATIGDDPNELGDALRAVDFGTGRYATQLSVGDDHACALLDNGSIKCWGSNDSGRLGYGDTADRGDSLASIGDSLPAIDLGTDTFGQLYTAIQVSAGYGHTCAVLNDGNVKCWGDGYAGQLGYDDNKDRGDGAGEMGDSLPFVDLGTDRSAVAVYTGYDQTCAVLDSGAALKCWGGNRDGDLGLCSGDYGVGNGGVEYSGHLCSSDTDAAIAEIADVPADHTCALGRKQVRYGFDTDKDSALSEGEVVSGIGYCHTEDFNFLMELTTLPVGSDACPANGGVRYEAGLDIGDNGVFDNEMGDALPEIDLGSSSGIVDIKLGYDNICALLANETFKCWGDGAYSGLDTTEDWGDDANEPPADAPTPDMGSGLRPTSISGRGYHTCALLDNADVKCWGYSEYGELGNPLFYEETIGDGDPGIEMGDNLPKVDIY